ncbi:helix-turn-helix domain-containing protein [Deferrisoma camini]|uniref:helix-turn-helix domain-containing protein n=1 Tax=Deferrisoma camini TaxID=1035120 RepID=UPI00046D38D6|nr:helix-turn-helix domain-containing protein [Deferrisoma camini]
MQRLETQEVLARLVEVFGELDREGWAELFQVVPTAVSQWKRRRRIPLEHLEALADRHGLSLDWLCYGVGSPYRPKVRVKAKELWAGLSPAAQQVVERITKDKDVLRALEVVYNSGKKANEAVNDIIKALGRLDVDRLMILATVATALAEHGKTKMDA